MPRGNWFTVVWFSLLLLRRCSILLLVIKLPFIQISRPFFLLAGMAAAP
jgi:hypothetical protein